MITSVDNETVAELVRLIREGCEDAGPFLVSVCGARLSKYVNLLASDMSETDREAICEAAVERAVRQIDKFDPLLGTFDAWLRGYVRYVVMERRQASREILTDPIDLPEPYSLSDSASGSMSRLAQPLTETLVSLPEADQMIIRLRDFEDLPYSEIAALLNVREAATRQRHLRALKRLRKALEARPEFNSLLNEERERGSHPK